MARVSLDLENKEDLKVLQAEGWRIARGFTLDVADAARRSYKRTSRCL